MARSNAQIAREARRRTNARRFLATHPEARMQIDAHHEASRTTIGAVSIQGAVVEEPMVEGVHGTTIPQEA